MPAQNGLGRASHVRFAVDGVLRENRALREQNWGIEMGSGIPARERTADASPVLGQRALDRKTEPATYLPPPEEGLSLMRAFLRIRSRERRRAVLDYAMREARMDEADRVSR